MPPTSRVPAALEELGGVASWAQLASATSNTAVARALASGVVLRVLPGVLALPDHADDARTRQRAALLFAGAPAALSHTTALQVHGLPVPEEVAQAAVHVTVPHQRRRTVPASGTWRVALHRCRAAPTRQERDGLAVVSAQRAVVESWPLLSGSDQRAPALLGVRKELLTAADLVAELAVRRQADGAAELRQLVAKILAGCRSELELWGYEHVFTGPEFAHLRRQVEVVAAGRLSVLDCYDPRTALAVELDGRAYHGSPWQRERDIARDARVAGLGIQTLRFSHRRLTTEPEACRREVLEVAAVRQAQLAGAVLPAVVEVAGPRGGAPRLLLQRPGRSAG
ncbi:DUF559 domain-containing protein [Quadrisphaera sp. KR29]|uniref:DUF559 domain-containing protein n=1 Tax=Quadrisphaera sp. KR29 TaxID=3461391 RepID=UPI00404501F5